MNLPAFHNFAEPPPEQVRIRARITRRDKFSPEEDIRLRDLVEMYGCHAWPSISKVLGAGRTARQCRDRWNNYLDPDLCHDPWTPQEDQLLLHKYSEIGNHWGQIQEFLVKRSVNSVRNRYLKLSGTTSRSKYNLPPTSIVLNNTSIRIPPPPTPMHIIPTGIPMYAVPPPQNIVQRQARPKRRTSSRTTQTYQPAPRQYQQGKQVPDENPPAKTLEIFDNLKEELESWAHNPQIFSTD